MNYELWGRGARQILRSWELEGGIAIRSGGIAIRWRGIRSGGGENWSFFVRFWLRGGISA